MNPNHDRISREKVTVLSMVTLFCHSHHRHDGSDHICAECRELVDYACKRLNNCPKGNLKGSCRKCDIHCYSPQMRQAILRVMRYSGPRMILYHPLAAVRHLLDEWTH